MNAETTALLHALTDRRRRHVLSVLVARAERLSERDLALYTASAVMDKPRAAVTDDEYDRVLTGLHHVHLPILEDGGLIERDDRRVRATIDPAVLESEAIAERLRSPDAVSTTEEEVLASLAVDRRQRVVSVLRESSWSISIKELGRKVADRERGVTPATSFDDLVDEIVDSLTHVHLPNLAAVGLLEYDRSDRSIRGRIDAEEALVAEDLGGERVSLPRRHHSQDSQTSAV